jgi:hypothetical protein
MTGTRTRSAHARISAIALLTLAPAARAEQVPLLGPAERPITWERAAPPRDLVLLLNVAGLLGNPFDDNRGWRIEGAVDKRQAGHLSSAVVIGGGSVAVDGYPSEWALGDFQRGLFLGPVLDFRRVGAHIVCSAGPLLGYRYTTRAGVAAEVHLGVPLVSDSFTTTDAPDRLPLRDAWRAMMPGVFVGVGASLRTGGPLRPRDPPR